MSYANASLLAVTPANSRGRVHDDLYAQTADCPFEFDRQRILASTSFRRLMHKTQVFVADCGDHYRTRLTHTLEVVAQAQRLARALDLNERLAGGVAMAHDLGHAPFGHAGEQALQEILKDHGGFEHNRQSLRVVDYLEHPYPEFRGLNLTFELRESLIKHRTRYDHPAAAAATTAAEQELLASGPSAPLEGQVVNLADAIAYTLHDIEDGLLDGSLTQADLEESKIWREAAAPVAASNRGAPLQAIRRPILDAIGRRLIADAVEESLRRIDAAGPRTVDDVRRCGDELVAFLDSTAAAMKQLGNILARCVYRNERVARMDQDAKGIVRDLFHFYLREPSDLPERYAARVPEQGLHRTIADYVAGMTDRFCRGEHDRLRAAGSSGAAAAPV